MIKKLLLAICFGGILSCSNSDDRLGSDLNDAILPEKISEINLEANVIFDSKIKYNGTKISEIIWSYGEKEVFQYEGDYISKITTYNKQQQEQKNQVFTYKNGKIASRTVTEFPYIESGDSFIKYISSTTYQWTSSDHVIENTIFLNTSDLKPITREYFFSNGNCIKKLFVQDPNNNGFITKVEYNYFYDNKINPLREVKGMQALFDSDYAINNLIREESKHTGTGPGATYSTLTTYANEYNSNNYLTKRVSRFSTISNGNTTTRKEYTKAYIYNK
ncbi:hypothetical protein M2T82_01010 [Elizabethkingia ursingii]|uniref:hypothetical protein n=1 Tax=Elizabethkingia ursingii TaxID=1756150 RepID=UPI002010F796|nr:hypothetical protein [Elizabethkingia ursingii]MCL1666632.1 hypothetical protein [Elizabethkingia ursingii]